MLIRIALITASVLLMAGCGSKSIDVNYNAEAAADSRSDWFPIPGTDSRTVTSADRAVERPPSSVSEPLFVNSGENLAVTESLDSFGNTSLVVNRDVELTWELLESAVGRLEWAVVDRNRNEYQLVLSSADQGTGLFAWLGRQGSASEKEVRLVLVSRVDNTGISAVYPDEEVLPAEENQRLMTELKAELLQES